MTPTTRRAAIVTAAVAAAGLITADLAGWLDDDLPALAAAYRQALPGIEHLGVPSDPRLDILVTLAPANRRERLLAWIAEDAVAGHLVQADGWPATAVEAALAARF